MAHKVFLVSLILGVACVVVPPPVIVPQPPQPLVAGVQTHFDSGVVDPQVLRDLKSFGYTVARMDLQRVDNSSAQWLIQTVKQAGLRPLAIVRDAGQMLSLPDDIDFELRNEPDLEGPDPQTYRGLMVDIARVADGRRVWVGAISNFNDRGFKYLRAIGEIPPGVGVSMHNYGDGEFAPTERKYAYFIDIVGQRPFVITEFGYPTADIPELESASLIKREFEWWAQHGAHFAVVYQLNDGHRSNETYGLRRVDGSWKPSAHIFIEPTPTNTWGR